MAGSDIQLTVLADRWIQRWSLNTATGVEHYLFEDFDVCRQIRDAFHQKLWRHRDAQECDVCMLDMHATRSGTVLVLAAAINAAHTPQFHYALCTFVEVSGGSGGYEMRNFCLLRHTTFAAGAAGGGQEQQQQQPSAMRLLVAGAGLVYVFDARWVLQVQLNASSNDIGGSDNELCGSGERFDCIDVQAHNDNVLSGHLVRPLHPQVVLFLRQQGFVSIQPTLVSAGGVDGGAAAVQQRCDETVSPFHTSSMMDATIGGLIRAAPTADGGLEQHTNLSLFGLNPDEHRIDGDAVSQLKAAFIYHLKKNPGKCAEVLRDLMDADARAVDLDGIVVKIACDLVDDVPASDPRWEERMASGINAGHHQSAGKAVALGSSTSLQIVQQLNEKKIVLQHFVEFLHSMELWPLLRTAHADREAGAARRPSAQILSDISEKVVATIALKKLHTKHARLIDEAIRLVLRLRNETDSDASDNLTAQDLFYVKVTRVQELFGALAGLVVAADESGASGGNQSPMAENAFRPSDVNSIVLAMLEAVLKSRTANSTHFSVVPSDQLHFEYLPWTAMAGRGGLQDTILQLIGNTVLYGTGAAGSGGSADVRQSHYRQLVELVDYYLDGRKSYLDSVRDTQRYSVLLQQYETQRSELIRPLVGDGQYELATKLAEKYLDFQTLVQICDRTDNQLRLDEYIRKYQTLNFSQFAINWHLRQNKRGDLFQRFKHNQADLSRFLADHPSLAWVQAVFNGDMAKAGRVLVELAEQEAELVARKKTMLSLAKLVSLIADGDFRGQVARIDDELRLIEYQALLSGEVLEALGYDATEQKVLTAEEIINVSISDCW